MKLVNFRIFTVARYERAAAEVPNDRGPATRSAATTVWPRAEIDSQAGWSFAGRS